MPAPSFQTAHPKQPTNTTRTTSSAGRTDTIGAHRILPRTIRNPGVSGVIAGVSLTQDGHRSLLALQRSAGNRAITALLQLQRDDDEPAASSDEHSRLGLLETLSRTWRTEAQQVAAAHSTDARIAAQEHQLEAVAPILDQLTAFPAAARFDHPDRTIQDDALAAAQLRAALHAHQQIGNRDAQRDARAAGHLPEGAWCGAFAFAAASGAGLDTSFRADVLGTGGLMNLFTYRDNHRWIWTGAEWLSTQDYHAQRGSLRNFTEVPAAPDPASLDIRPGDIVLIDNTKGTLPDHIRTAVSYDPTTGDLVSVGGNEGEQATTNHAGVGESTKDIRTNTAATTTAGRKQARIQGIGRWAAADFESHPYSTSGSLPTRPPRTAPTGGATRPATGGGPVPASTRPSGSEPFRQVPASAEQTHERPSGQPDTPDTAQGEHSENQTTYAAPPAPGSGVQLTEQEAARIRSRYPKVVTFYRKYESAATEVQNSDGIPALFTLAQLGVETGWAAAHPGNNLFGVKASEQAPEEQRQKLWTLEYHRRPDMPYDEIAPGFPQEVPDPRHPGQTLWKYRVKLWFRRYASEAESIRDHTKVLKHRRYAEAFRHTDDPVVFAQAVAAGGYATAANYAEALTNAIHLLDRVAAAITQGAH